MKQVLLTVAAITFLFAGNMARAQGGGMMGGGMGGGMMGYGQGGGGMMGPGQWGYPWGYQGEGSEAQPFRSREEFYDATRQLRRDMNAKEDALHRELNRQDPDGAEVNRLRGELSDMRQELDRQWQGYHGGRPQGRPQGRNRQGGPWQPRR